MNNTTSNLPVSFNSNLHNFFTQIFQEHSHQVLIRDIKKGQIIRTTYEQFGYEVQAWANALMHYDIQPGDRIGILARSSPNWLKAFIAASHTKATIVCLDVGLDDAQLIRLIEQSELKLLLIASNDEVTFTKVAYAGVTTLDIDKKLREIHQTNSHLRTLRDTDPSIACILYTSGTTGLFKGVLLEHSAILASISGNIRITSVGPADQFLCILPAHHVYGLICLLMSPLVTGASILFPERLDGPALLQALALSKPTIIVGVPRVYQLFGNKIDSEIAKKPSAIRGIIYSLIKLNYQLRKMFNINFGKYLFFKVHKTFGGHVRLLVSGGAALDSKLFDKLYGFGFNLIEGYGLTETCASIIVNPVQKPKSGSVGMPVPNIEIKIADQPDNMGEGEICARGALLMRGYFRDETSTYEAFKDGWYHTGDLGYIDEEGYVFITGRIKELIVLANGKKVMPTMVETYFSDIPGTNDFALVGMPKADGAGEELHAVVVVDNTAITHLTLKDIQTTIESDIRHRLSRLPEWWRFKKVHFLEIIPRTTTLKVKRKALAQLLHEKNLA